MRLTFGPGEPLANPGSLYETPLLRAPSGSNTVDIELVARVKPPYQMDLIREFPVDAVEDGSPWA